MLANDYMRRAFGKGDPEVVPVRMMEAHSDLAAAKRDLALDALFMRAFRVGQRKISCWFNSVRLV